MYKIGSRFTRLTICLCFLASFLLSTETFDSNDVDHLLTQLEPEIQMMMSEGKIPSAAIALVYKDKIIWCGGFGYSNLWASTRANSKTVYLIGSTFKTMSMFALLQQMEKGKFKLDDRVNDYLSDFKIKGERYSNPVKFRHLLTHVSGLPRDFDRYLVWGETVPPPIEDYLKNNLKLKYPPLTKVEYSNMAYTLIAELIERFSGISFKDYIKEYIFKPVELSDTAFIPRPDMVERLAIPYVYDEEKRIHKPTAIVKANVWPAGIVYGTIKDQANWLITNLNGGVFKGRRLLNEQTFYEIMTRQFDQFAGPISYNWLNETTGYGLTWWVSKKKGDTIFAHSGSVEGYTAFLAGNLDKKVGFAILTNGNKAHPHLYKLAKKALDIMNDFRWGF
jgi:CubicO group peptidase (beta-lactamase class C family)